LSVCLSSVPKDRTFAKAIVDSFVSIVYKIPSYRISLFEINEILQPMNAADIFKGLL